MPIRRPNTSYYVYVLFRANGQPFYIGRGRGPRWLHHERDVRNNTAACKKNIEKTKIIRHMLRDGWTEIPKAKLAEGLTSYRASQYEIAYIAAIGRHPDGPLVNLTPGGTGARRLGTGQGKTLSPEHRAKISAARKGKKLSPEHRAKLSAARRGKPRPPSFAIKMSAKLKGREFSPEWRAKLSAAQQGKKRSDEFREKQSIAHKGRQHSPEHVKKVAAANQGKKRSAEVREMISANQRRNSPQRKRDEFGRYST